MSLQLQEALVSEKICDDLKNGVSLSRYIQMLFQLEHEFRLKTYKIGQKQPLDTQTYGQHQKLSRSVDKKKTFPHHCQS